MEADDDDATMRDRPRAAAPGKSKAAAGDEHTDPVAHDATRSLPGDGGDRAEVDTSALPSRFEPLGVIGRGGMGWVLRVIDRSLGREVAVKLMRRNRLDSEHARLRFMREARAAGMLRHPNIVTVHDVGPEGDYLVMELVEGESLGKRIRHGGKLPPDEVRRIGDALLGALATAHREGIIHRDVKPGNILLDASGAVKLTDFGIASFTDSELTSTGQMIGTPAYMAPEQLRARRVDERADVYGAGATLFEAATGAKLHEHAEIEDPQRAIIEATGDAALAQAIAKAVRDREVERFQTAQAFADALARRELAPLDPTRRQRAPSRWRVVFAVGAAAAIAVGSYAGYRVGTATPAATQTRAVTVAMLPFRDGVGDPRLDFAASGLPHLLGEQLGRVDNLRVLRYYRVGARLPSESAPHEAWLEAARELGAELIVRGEITPASGSARIAILVERSDGTPIDRIERAVPIDGIAEAVQALAPAVAGVALGAPSTLRPEPGRAFELERELQLGIGALERMDFPTADRHLNAALARDEGLAEAHYHLAILAWWNQGKPKPHIERALAGSLEPVERDFLVGLAQLVELEYPAVVDYFRELARRYPDHRDLHYGLFEALYHGGHPEAAMTAYRRLRELAPRFDIGVDHAIMHYLTRGDAEGIRWTFERWQPPPAARGQWSARERMAAQRYGDAVRILERATEDNPDSVEVRRLLVEAYAVSGQLPLAREAATRLAAADPGYSALASHAIAVAGHGDYKQRARAAHAVALGIPGVKNWAAWLDVLALELPDGSPSELPETSRPTLRMGRIVSQDVGFAILAAVEGDRAALAAFRASHFPQVAAVAAALAASDRGDHAAAVDAWRQALDLNADGRMQLYAWYRLARGLEAQRNHDGVIAACDEVIVPRVFTWSWASLVGPCLHASALAAAALGRGEDARRRWQQLATIRGGADPSDPLLAAARAALASGP